MNYQLRECRECGYKVVEGAKTCRKCGASKPTISKELYSKYRNLQIRKLDDEIESDDQRLDDEEWVDDLVEKLNSVGDWGCNFILLVGSLATISLIIYCFYIVSKFLREL